MEKMKNYLSQELKELKVGLLNPSYGVDDDHGNLVLNDMGYPILKDWVTDKSIADEQGFDKSVNINGRGYKCEVVLPKGTRICRYGAQTGKFATLVGTPYDKLGLPWDPKTLPYGEYVVTADDFVVTVGIIAPAFDSPGGAVQFVVPDGCTTQCKQGRLREDKSWLNPKTSGTM